MLEQDIFNQTPQHVAAWHNASDTHDIFTHIDSNHCYNYKSEQDLLLDAWFTTAWRITIGSEVLEGTLVNVDRSVYGLNGHADPAFEVEIDTGGDFPLLIKGHFGMFGMTPQLTSDAA